MRFRMWTYDLAREQSPNLDQLRRLLDVTREGGYNAFGLYMEHRFAYPSTPWSWGTGVVGPETIKILESEYPDIQIVPFVNLLGHFEGMLYTERGKRYREQTLRGMQACPSCPEFVALAEKLVDDVLSIFASPLVHIGGDETWQLGRCARCQARIEPSSPQREGEGWEKRGKAQLYGEHFGPLAKRVVGAGRRPAVWGDMFLEHPSALDYIPKETLIFDWQYFESPLATSRSFVEKGFEVVCCPSIQTYNAAWCHLSESEKNVRDAVSAARELDAEGVCVTTWECGLFGNYETVLPIIGGLGKLLDDSLPLREGSGLGELLSNDSAKAASTPAPSLKGGEYRTEWVRLMSDELATCGGPFAHSGTRTGLKTKLFLFANPFLAWLEYHEILSGEVGTKALTVLDHAMSVAQGPSERGVTQFVVKAIEFVRLADQARQAYAQELPGVAIASLAPCRQIFDDLEKIAVATQANIGGSSADIHRCRAAKESVERAIRRIKEYGDGALGYLPAFEIITHPNFIPHDQACWWLINSPRPE